MFQLSESFVSVVEVFFGSESLILSDRKAQQNCSLSINVDPGNMSRRRGYGGNAVVHMVSDGAAELSSDWSAGLTCMPGCRLPITLFLFCLSSLLPHCYAHSHHQVIPLSCQVSGLIVLGRTGLRPDPFVAACVTFHFR